MSMPRPPVLWSIAGLDTAGGAGLSADQRAADAMGVHLCPVAACLTAQHSQGVEAVMPVDEQALQAQLSALHEDLPPDALKTGLLGSVAAIELVARCIDRLRERRPGLPLVVDPVLRASSGGAAFADEDIVRAYRESLVPRATVLTPNRAEARRLLGQAAVHTGSSDGVPPLAAALRDQGARAVIITGGDAPEAPGPLPFVADWLDTPHATGWLTGPRVATRHAHGTGCTFASATAAALALGHVSADAIVLGKMLTHDALVAGHPAGQGAGPVIARHGFALRAPLPWLGLGDELPWLLAPEAIAFAPFTAPADRLYGILSTAQEIEAAVQAGLRCVQLRHKARQGLEDHLPAAAQACARTGAQLFVNDHWRQALALPQHTPALPLDLHLGVHLGQEDLLALSPADGALLRQARRRVMLGLSSHSLWELARAAGCGPSYIACGPVLPTQTKDMPWRAQGTDNLAWWVARSPVPVVAIGGLLTTEDVALAARGRPAAVCLVRALTQQPGRMADTAREMAAAIGPHLEAPAPPPALPHPVL